LKTAAYCRNSITKEIQKTSIEKQIDEIKKAAESHHIIIDQWYKDEEVSARKVKMDERQHFTRLMDDIRSGIVSRLIVSRRDRLARNVKEHFEMYRFFQEYQVQVIFAVGEPPFLYTPEGELTEAIYAGMNEQEGDRIVGRILDTRFFQSTEGMNSGGQLPYGFYTEKSKRRRNRRGEEREEPTDKHIKVDPVKAPIVKKIFEGVAESKLFGMTNMMHELQAKGYLPTDVIWSTAKLKSWLRNIKYTGRFKYFQKEGFYISSTLRVVSGDLWDKVQTKLDQMENVLKRNRITSKKQRFLLNGRILCEKCNKNISGFMNSAGQTYYSCKCRDRFDKNAIEQTVFDHLNAFYKTIYKLGIQEHIQRYVYLIVRRLEAELNYEKASLQKLLNQVTRESELWLAQRTLKRKQKIEKYHDRIKIKHEKISIIQKNLEAASHLNTELSRYVMESKQPLIDAHLELESQMMLLDETLERIIKVDQRHITIVLKHPKLIDCEVNCFHEYANT
jgi:site-specific DNA recombinase